MKVGISMRYLAPLALVPLMTLAGTGIANALDPQPLPVSKGVYRLPFEDGTDVKFGNDHTNHPVTLNRIDMSATGDGDHKVVAAGAGTIRRIEDENNTFCPDSKTDDTSICDGYSGPSASCCEVDDPTCNANCANNYIWIEHPNGEWTKYSHIRKNSADELDRFEGEFVEAGTELGTEGDVGFASGPHVHFEVAVPAHVEKGPGDLASPDPDAEPDGYDDWFTADGFLRSDGIQDDVLFEDKDDDGINDPDDDVNRKNRIPVFCQIGFAAKGDSRTAGPCDNQCTQTQPTPTGVVAAGAIFYDQSGDDISTSEDGFVIEADAGAALRAGHRVTLGPGFEAKADSYFSASIAPCDNPGGG